MYEIMGIGKLRVRRDMHFCGLMYKRSFKNEYIDKRESVSQSIIINKGTLEIYVDSVKYQNTIAWR